MKTITLNSGKNIPVLGFGTYKLTGDEAGPALAKALELGYRHIDTAAFYGNEEIVGRAIRESGIPREELFITTKLWNDDQRDHRQREAFEESLERLGLDYVDLYLIHWPVVETINESWKVLEDLKHEGLAHSIGVCNFRIEHLDRLLGSAEITPAVDQLELHPRMVDTETIAYLKDRFIAVEAWAPIGRGSYEDDPVVSAIAEEVGATEAQVLLAWHRAKDVIALPKSGTPERIEENYRSLDVELSTEQVARIDELNVHEYLNPETTPDTFDF